MGQVQKYTIFSKLIRKFLTSAPFGGYQRRHHYLVFSSASAALNLCFLNINYIKLKIYTKRYGIFKTPVIRCIEINVYQSINQRYGNFIERFFNHPPAPFFKFCLHSSYVMVNIGPVRLSYYSRGARPPNIFQPQGGGPKAFSRPSARNTFRFIFNFVKEIHAVYI